MKKITVGTGYRISLTKALCEENYINEGDSYEVVVNNEGVITLYPIISRDESDKITTTEPDRINKSVNKNEEFISNLEEGQNFYNKCYSDCGLIIRTKKKYLKQYCERCKGQLLDNYTDNNYTCPYLSMCDEDSTDTDNDVVDSNYSDKSVSEEAINKSTEVKEFGKDAKVNQDSVKNLKDVIRQVDKEQAKQSNKFIVDSINKHIEQLLQSLKSDIQKTSESDIDFKSRADTVIEPVAYNHYHTCDRCNNEYQTGFILDKTMFLCKECLKKDFLKYLKEIGKEFSDV